MIEVFASHRHSSGSLFRIEGSFLFLFAFRFLHLSLGSSVEVKLGCEIFLDLHFTEVVVVLVLEMVFGEHLYCVQVLLGLHRYDVIVFLLFLINLSIRNIAVQGL